MVIKLKKVIFLIISLILLTGCGKRTENPIVTMEISDYGTIKIELYPKYAPNTVANFVNLVESGFYNDNTFHRLVPGFVLQGGDPDGDGTGGPGYTIKGEFSENGYVKNTLKHDKGVVSMARTNMPNSAGSQFFIVLDDTKTIHASLDNKYAAFGKVIEGMEIIENIEKNAAVKDNQSGKLKKNITIKNATVDTFGKEYSVKKIQENN
ncbi:peptidyl-prolyl cis-trans isomerase [Clostridium sp. CAG:609]|nr:peptidyl-prolyl cis-trans isomerase [Clostridium sp. CAG:609]